MNNKYKKGSAEVAVSTIVGALIFLGVMISVMVLSGSSSNTNEEPRNAIDESNQIVGELSKNVPVPDLTTSSERSNVARRAELFDNEDKISYIYLVNYGRVMSFFTVQGKVSSLRSYMTPVDKLVGYNGDDCNSRLSSTGNAGCYVVEAPDIDGTYGENVDGIFFFTTEGAYVEWRGDYMMSDQPLQLTTQPELVRQIQ